MSAFRIRNSERNKTSTAKLNSEKKCRYSHSLKAKVKHTLNSSRDFWSSSLSFLKQKENDGAPSNKLSHFAFTEFST